MFAPSIAICDLRRAGLIGRDHGGRAAGDRRGGSSTTAAGDVPTSERSRPRRALAATGRRARRPLAEHRRAGARGFRRGTGNRARRRSRHRSDIRGSYDPERRRLHTAASAWPETRTHHHMTITWHQIRDGGCITTPRRGVPQDATVVPVSSQMLRCLRSRTEEPKSRWQISLGARWASLFCSRR